MEKSSTPFDFYKSFAKKTGREIDFKEQPYPSAIVHKVTYHRRSLYIRNGRSYFICFADSKEMGPQGLYSGVFIPFDAHKGFKMTARKKDVLDRLNPFSNKKLCKTGIPSFDAKVRIESSGPAEVKRVFQNRSMQQLVIDGLDVDDAMMIGINALDLGFVPELKEGSHLGIFTRQKWFDKEKEIEDLFKLIELYHH